MLKPDSGKPLKYRHILLEQTLNSEMKLDSEVIHEARIASHETLYAIPTSLLDAINEGQRYWPRQKHWFSVDQLVLEKRFSEKCSKAYSIGLSAKGYVVFPELDNFKPVPQINLGRFQAQLDHLSKLTGKKFNTPLSSYQTFNDSSSTTLSLFHEQRLAYLGWLLSQCDFQVQRTQLLHAWNAAGCPAGLLEGRNCVTELLNNPMTDACLQELAQSFLNFYRQWDLARMATWELPVQQHANLGAPAKISEMMNLNGPVIQLPSTMKLPAKIKPAMYLEVKENDPLQEFREMLKGKQTKGLAEWFVIHFYQEVVLRSILGNTLNRSQGRLDEVLTSAFAKFAPLPGLVGIPTESIKKLRQRYQ